MFNYDDLGVRSFINGMGTVTTSGGSLMAPEVLEAMRQAADHFIDLDELYIKAGEKLAQMIGVESVFVSCGAASGMQLSAAACLTGTDEDRISRLPHINDPKNEFVISKVDPHFYIHQGIEMVGGKLVRVGTTEQVTTEDIVNGIGPNTAVVVYFLGQQTKEQLQEVLVETKKAGVSTIVDAAAQLPPRSNLTEIVGMGADLVIFSGGKGMRGPQGTGLVVGSKEKVGAVRLNSSPWSAIGRGMKVGKEEIMGLVTAVELFLAKDENEELREWDRMADLIVQSLSGLKGVKAEVRKDQGAAPAIVSRAYIDLDSSHSKTIDQVIEELKNGDPSISVNRKVMIPFVHESQTEFRVDPMTLVPGEEEIVARRLRETLS